MKVAFRAALRPALVTACLGAAACGGSSSTEELDPALLAEARAVVEGRGLQPLPGPPARPPALVELGQALYFDKELSGNRDVSCATCHLASRAGSDGRTLPAGVGGIGVADARAGGAMIPRHSPTTLNVHLNRTLFWDGRVELRPGSGLTTPAGSALTASMEAVFSPGLEVLGAQAMFPPTSRDEMRGQEGENELADFADEDISGIWSAIVERVLSFPTYAAMFQDAYPGTALADINMAHVGNAIAAFEERAFSRVDSPFQAWLQGDDDALSAAALQGLVDYFGPESRCADCHNGDAFTDGRHHNIGMPQFGPGKGDGLASDDDFGRERVTGLPADRYRFRTPTLLNVELTAPYGHLGQFSTLRSMLEHYSDVDAGLTGYQIADHVDDSSLIGTQVGNQREVLSGLHPSVQAPLPFDVDAMLAFMESLTAESARDLSDVVPDGVPSGLPVDR